MLIIKLEHNMEKWNDKSTVQNQEFYGSMQIPLDSMVQFQFHQIGTVIKYEIPQ